MPFFNSYISDSTCATGSFHSVWVPDELIPPYPSIAATPLASIYHNSVYFPIIGRNLDIFSITTNSTTATSTCVGNVIVSGNTIYWPQWHDDIHVPSIIEERTEAERIRLEEYHRVQAEESEKRRIVSKKAKEIFLEHLTPFQREMVEKNGWFVIEGGKTGKRYKIKSGAVAGNVEELDGNKVVARYCCHLPHIYPHYDHNLAQKLMLEWDEEEFLRKAHKTNIA
jgi:predicted DNA-binding protein (UPF0251 family)